MDGCERRDFHGISGERKFGLIQFRLSQTDRLGLAVKRVVYRRSRNNQRLSLVHSLTRCAFHASRVCRCHYFSFRSSPHFFLEHFQTSERVSERKKLRYDAMRTRVALGFIRAVLPGRPSVGSVGLSGALPAYVPSTSVESLWLEKKVIVIAAGESRKAA